MKSLLRVLPVVACVTALLTGCVVDRTGSSGSYLMKARLDALRERSQTIDKDLARERSRVDRIEERASEARRRYADAGASVQAMMEDLAYLRGDIAALKDELARSGALSEDTDYRLTALEAQLAHVEGELLDELAGYEEAPLPPPPPPPEDPPASDTDTDTDTSSAPDEVPGDEEDGEADSAESDAEESSSGSDPVVVPPSESGDSTTEEEAGPSVDQVLFGEGQALYAEGRWRDAGRKFLKVRKKHPDSPHVLESQFLLSMCLYELERYKDALNEFQRVVDANASAELSARSMYMQGLCFVGLGTAEDKEAAEVFFSDVIAKWPGSTWATRSKERLEELGAS